MAEITTHTMPNGDVVHYRDSDHQYNRDLPFTRKGRVPGVSTISKNAGDTNTEPLMDWAVRLDREGVAREALRAQADQSGASWAWDEALRASWLFTAETIGQRLKDGKHTWRDIRNEASTRGNVSHRILEQLCEGVDPLPSNGYDSGVIAWWKATRPTPALTEQVVYSGAHNFAGRFDLYTEAGALIDLKTSGFIANTYAVQLNLYRLGMMVAGFPVPKRLAIVQVGEDGSFAEIPIPINRGWAQTALDAYAMGKEISSAIRAGKKEALGAAA